jgi:hypothetical protein
MSYLRFTPDEFRAIKQAYDSVELSDDFFVFFKYFLVESLSGMLPFLAMRISRFRRPQLELLYGFIRRQKASEVKSRGQTRREECECGLTSEELQAIRRASGPFFLHDGSLARLVPGLSRVQPRQDPARLSSETGSAPTSPDRKALPPGKQRKPVAPWGCPAGDLWTEVQASAVEHTLPELA